MKRPPELPYAAEIREARAQLDACQEAMLLNQHLVTARTAIGILDLQSASGAHLPQPLPGEEVILSAASAYPSLRDLPQLTPEKGSSAVLLRIRQQQLELIEQTLRPLLDQNDEAAERLLDLQHKQRHALEDPRWETAVQELILLGTERDRLSLTIAPLQNKIAMIEPVIEMLHGFHPLLQSELIAASRTEDPQGSVAWRTATMAHQQLIGLANVIEQLGLHVQYPFEPMVPDSPHPRHRIRLRKESGAVLQWMSTLSDTLAHQVSMLKEEVERLQRQHDQAEKALKERMG